MSETNDDHRQAVALFRYGVIADLIHLPPGSPGITDKLRAKASAGLHHPRQPPHPHRRRDSPRLAQALSQRWVRRALAQARARIAVSPAACRTPSPRR